MTTQPKNYGRLPQILTIFVIINIIGEVGNVIAWQVIPEMRMSLDPSILAATLGETNALHIGSAILLLVAAAYAVSIYGLMKRKTWAPLLIIGVSVANRALALLLYEISPAFAFWAIWTVILVVVSYMVWRKLRA
jgi:hypothetical protein